MAIETFKNHFIVESVIFLFPFSCKIYPVKKKVDGDELQILIILP
jgi:hypothetical protein